MLVLLKTFLTSNEFIFNSFGQIFFKKRFIFNFIITFYRYISNF